VIDNIFTREKVNMVKKKFIAATVAVLAFVNIHIALAQVEKVKTQNQNSMTTEQVKKLSIGDWVSIAPEVRPSVAKDASGNIKPFYLTRTFTYSADEKFTLVMINSADPYGKVPLVKIVLSGRTEWQGEHPIAPGAQKIHYIADAAYDLTPLNQGFADAMNSFAGTGYGRWAVGETQSILGKSFPPFGLTDGQIYGEYDLIYFNHDLMFWGAKHVDGRSFEKEENHPDNLQIPMARKE
jgi:hypothetical protein